MNSSIGYLILREKTVIVGLVVAAVLYVAGQLNIVVDSTSVQAVVAPIVAGLIARFFTVPADEVIGVNEETGVRPHKQRRRR